ncbi:hypothetical protein G6L37_07375 [Agrobacterium rubi]|nr:hypothetical protein [Agrobacterium rubi]NTF25188.1 hypothetical protein [Agrobacterium rubi]
MDHEQQKLDLMMAAADRLLTATSPCGGELMDGLADRPKPGAKKRARAALVAHLKAVGEFRAAVSGIRGVTLAGSAASREGQME